jgi:2-polyprenyl-3-methyl-5-hydroxy-6-metoxy-1,4-benzoquinol methylase
MPALAGARAHQTCVYVAQEEVLLMSLIRQVIDANIRISAATDRLFPRRFQIDGNSDFSGGIVSNYLKPGSVIYDIGGGKTPFLSLGQKQSLGARIVGVDISEKELKAAPAGIYDQFFAEDICTYQGAGDGDLVICRAVLEHVKDTEAAIAAIGTCLKPGGVACIFVPSRNALFARINLIIPEKLKKAILFSIFPHARSNQGFESYYNNCTPRDVGRLAKKHRFAIDVERYY